MQINVADWRIFSFVQWNIAHKNHMTWVWDQSEKTALWPTFVGHDSYRILRHMILQRVPNPWIKSSVSINSHGWLKTSS